MVHSVYRDSTHAHGKITSSLLFMVLRFFFYLSFPELKNPTSSLHGKIGKDVFFFPQSYDGSVLSPVKCDSRTLVVKLAVLHSDLANMLNSL